MFAAASGVLAAVAYLLRTAGLALLVAWVADSLIRRRFRQAAVRAACALLPVLVWQGYVWQITRSDEYQHPAYSYQRASYYYPNVTYAENSRLIDPFRPELGRIKIQDLVGRVVRNIAAVPLGLARARLFALVRTGFPTQFHKTLHVPLSDISRKLISGTLYTGLFLSAYWR